MICKKLHEDLMTSSPPTGMLRFMIVISPAEEHNHTVEYSNRNQTLQPRLRKEIHNLVNANICCVETIKIHLNEIVETMFENSNLPQQDCLNRCYRYYPSDQVIRFHIHQAFRIIKKNWYEQEDLEECVMRWEKEFPGDNFLFRPFQVLNGSEEEINLEEDPSSCTFLFCHQTKWQCDLLSRYGNDISLLDATYKTCRYSFPLFFIVVKTNSGYCNVGTFIVQIESTTLIEEALSQFKVWNPDWNPKYFMTDNSEVGINALEQTFPESTVYICAFHREQSWNRWLNKKVNVTKEAGGPLKKLWQNISASHTEEEYVQNIQEMYDHEAYQASSLAQSYFSVEWLTIHHRWIEAYHTKDFLFKVNANNGIECQNKILTHPYLTTTKYKTLTGIVKGILEDFLPDTIEKYCAANAYPHEEDTKYSDRVPEFLKNRSVHFIKMFMLYFEKGKEYNASRINYMGEGLFMVRNEENPEDWYPVDFQEATCSCGDFSKWRIPCTHMCAVFIHTEWGFDKLPLWYQESPYMTIDTLYSAGISDLYAKNSVLITEPVNQTCPDEDMNTDETLDEQLITLEEVDVNKHWEEFREMLKTVEGYSYLQHNPENVLKFSNIMKTLKEDMFSSATNSDEGVLLELTESTPIVQLEKVITLKPIKKKYLHIPHSNSKLKNHEKYAGQYDVIADQWCEWTTETVDVGVPMSVDQYVEIDMV